MCACTPASRSACPTRTSGPIAARSPPASTRSTSRSRCARRAGSPPRSSSAICRRPRCRASRCSASGTPSSRFARGRPRSSRSPPARASANGAATSIRTSACGSSPPPGSPSRPTSSGSATSISTASTRTTCASRSGSRIDLEHVGVQGFGLFGTDSGVTHGARLHARGAHLRRSLPGALERARAPRALDLGRPRRAQAGRSWSLDAPRRARCARSPAWSSSSASSTAAGPPPRSCAPRSCGCAAPRKHVYVYLAETNTRGYYVASAAERIYLDPAGGLRLIGLLVDDAVLPRPRRPPRRARRLRQDRRVQERARAVHAHRARPRRRARSARPTSTTSGRTSSTASPPRATSPPTPCARWIDRGPYTAERGQDGRPGRRAAPRRRDRGRASPSASAARCRSAARRAAPERANDWERPAVAVLFVDGDIIDGKSATIPLLGMKFVGMQTLMAAIQRARDDARVRAIVLRIDSPGGSALASDLIARELERTTQVKPVICSLGDVAASGGYFIAARLLAHLRRAVDADRIDRHLHRQVRPQRPGRQAGRLARELRARRARQHRLALPLVHRRGARAHPGQAALLLRPLRRSGRARPRPEAQRGRRHRRAATSGRATRRCARGLVDEFGGLMDAVAEAKRRAGLGEHDRVTPRGHARRADAARPAARALRHRRRRARRRRQADRRPPRAPPGARAARPARLAAARAERAAGAPRLRGRRRVAGFTRSPVRRVGPSVSVERPAPTQRPQTLHAVVTRDGLSVVPSKGQMRPCQERLLQTA